MNNKIAIVVTVFILLSIGLCGCDELDLNKPDYINVTVICTAKITLLDVTTSETSTPSGVIKVNIEIIKAGGERVSQVVLTPESGGETAEVSGTFKLYREQPIECIGNAVLSSLEAYSDYTFDSASYTIPWANFYPAYDFGDSATERIQLHIQGWK